MQNNWKTFPSVFFIIDMLNLFSIVWYTKILQLIFGMLDDPVVLHIWPTRKLTRVQPNQSVGLWTAYNSYEWGVVMVQQLVRNRSNMWGCKGRINSNCGPRIQLEWSIIFFSHLITNFPYFRYFNISSESSSGLSLKRFYLATIYMYLKYITKLRNQDFLAFNMLWELRRFWENFYFKQIIN